MFNKKFIIIFFFLTYTNFLGLINTEEFAVIIPLRDYALILVFMYLFDRLYNNRNSGIKISNLLFLKFCFVLSGIALLIILSMPLRGDTTLIEAFKSGRIYFTLLISVVIYDEIIESKSTIFVTKLIFYSAIFYTFLATLNNIVPAFVASVFTGGDTLISKDSWDTGSSRFVLKGNSGIYFIHLGFLLLFFRYLNSKHRKDLIYTVLFGLGMLLHGYRAPMLAFLSSSFIVAVIQNRLRKTFSLIPILLLLILFSYGFEQLSGQQLIVSKFISAYQEVTGDYTGTFEGRLDRSWIYQIPMFLKQYWFGYGFVHTNSQMAMQLGHQGDGLYSLYYIDFGYGTLANYFGLIGSGVILFYLFYLIVKTKAFEKSSISRDGYLFELLIAFIIGMLITNYSFGLLVSNNGLLPFAVVLGLVQGYSVLTGTSNLT